MLDWNDENGVWIQRLYACYSKNEVISPEALITWFIDYLNYPFIVEENHKTVICVPNDYVDMKSYPFQIVSFCAPDARVGEILRFSEKTELFCCTMLTDSLSLLILAGLGCVQVWMVRVI
ncbi:unnamed protein product [Heterobilharzia americana]|nr:unnamed protein product [Heterobilharzia americana]